MNPNAFKDLPKVAGCLVLSAFGAGVLVWLGPSFLYYLYALYRASFG